jgi:Capsule assembly protein Wzi/PAP2 superfamily
LQSLSLQQEISRRGRRLIYNWILRWGRQVAVLGLLMMSHPGWAQIGTSIEPATSPASQENSTVGKAPHPAIKQGAADSTNGFGLEPGEDPHNQLISPFVKHIVADQEQFWTSPARLHVRDLDWIAPFAGITGAFVASDSWMTKQVPDKSNQLTRSLHISDYSTYSMIGIGGGSFLLGRMTHNDHLAETGLLSGEAAINSTAVAYLFKEITQRQRPLDGNGHGDFFKGGSSFPSEHSAVAWSIASVWAHEYPGTLSQIAAYGMASAVTITRVTAKQHFPTDAVIGSVLGWYFGRQVYRAHHDPELGGTSWGSVLDEKTAEQSPNPDNMGSPYVLLDSWVYPAIDRLAALGYIQTAYLGIRPWTRMACAQMIEEAGEHLAGVDSSDEAAKTYRELTREFEEEHNHLDGASNLGADIESIYSRETNISGPMLRDGYHFGETITNDFGRPYGRGGNFVGGVSARAVAGPFAFYVRGEYQQAPAIASDPANVLQAIADADFTLPVSNAVRATSRFDLLEGSVSLNFHNTQISFGKQSQWMGPGESGSLLMSDNAEPIMMVKIDSVEPFDIPLLSRVLGPARSEFFLGQLAGHQFEFDKPNLLGPGNITPQPYLHGTKFNFKPTPNLEFGMGFTAQFAGPGLPFTWHNFIRTFYAHTGTGLNPGKRLSSADFSYRVPGIRQWLTVYGDFLVVDEYSPIGSSRASVNPGIYMPQILKLPKMEFRAEGIHEPTTTEFPSGFVYYGVDRYRSGYTNNGQLLGNWIGRAGLGGQGWLTYSFTPRTKLQFGYRHQEVSKAFIGGGRSIDYSANGTVMLRHDLAFSGSVQYEQWRFPVLATDRQSDVAASIQITFWPPWQMQK